MIYDLNADAIAGFTWGWEREPAAAMKYLHQRIFGTLVSLAAPLVQEFHGDLFHDALWIRDYVTGPMTFYFVARHSGTHIGTDLEMITYAARLSVESITYRCELAERDGYWSFEVHRTV